MKNIFYALFILILCVKTCHSYPSSVNKNLLNQFINQTNTSKDKNRNDGLTDKVRKQRKIFMDFVQTALDVFLEIYPNRLAYKLVNTAEEKHELLLTYYHPYNPHPMAIKKRSQRIQLLLKDYKKLNIDQDNLNSRQSKAMSQLKHVLLSSMSHTYGEDYNRGDWMLAPDMLCTLEICSFPQQFHFTFQKGMFQPKNSSDLDFLINAIIEHKTMLELYVVNMKKGIKAGMVRPYDACQLAITAVTNKFPKISEEGKIGILKERFTRQILSDTYLEEIDSGTKNSWKANHGKTIQESIRYALVEKMGKAITGLIEYLKSEHLSHCPPSEFVSGMASLPIDHIWTNGKEDESQITTKKLPTGELLDGKEAYKGILGYFTTKAITPEELFEIGSKKIKLIEHEMVKIAQKVTKMPNKGNAIEEFKNIIHGPMMAYNTTVIPDSESSKQAYKQCKDMKSAKSHCPIRYAAMEAWIQDVEAKSQILKDKVEGMFYFDGDKITAPRSEFSIKAQFKHTVDVPYYKVGTKRGKGKKPAIYYPFFRSIPGPKYSQTNTAAHEGWPGHHLQRQGFVENFTPPGNGDNIDWINWISPSTAFAEGWGLYCENPLISEGTDIYEGKPFEKFGMLQAQMWRALRLVIDTGLHYRGMKRQEAIDLLQNSLWETSDRMVNEITRYQSYIGQALSYSVGHQVIVKIRIDTMNALKDAGIQFDEKDFHYNLLKHGTAPLDYIEYALRKYVACKTGDATSGCGRQGQLDHSDLTKPSMTGLSAEMWQQDATTIVDLL